MKIHCTRKLLRYLNQTSDESEVPPTLAQLGDWYANIVSTGAEELIVLINVRTLLSVGIVARVLKEEDFVEHFVGRFVNLMLMLEFSNEQINAELTAFSDVSFVAAKNQSLLTSLQAIADRYQRLAEGGTRDKPASLSDAELKVCKIPWKRLNFRMPSEVAHGLLGDEMPLHRIIG